MLSSRHTGGVDVEVVAAGGAAALLQFGHGHLGADLHHFGGQTGPNGVQATQPAKQFGVLHGRYRPRQALKHVVVGVDQAGRDQVPAGIDHLVGSRRVRWQVGGRADEGDPVVANEDGGVAQFPGLGRVGMVQRGHAAGVVNQQVWHQDAFYGLALMFDLAQYGCGAGTAQSALC